MNKNNRSYLFLFLLIFSGLNLFSLDVIKLDQWVNDRADMISSSAENSLTQKLSDFEKSDSTQIVILTINSLEGEALEDYSIRVAEENGIGQKGKDNGLLLLVSKNDRMMRIEVGYGLEPVVTDLLAGRIIDYIISPNFKNGDFDKGFIEATDALIEATRGEFSPEEVIRNIRSNKKTNWLFGLLFFIPFFWGRMYKSFSNKKKPSLFISGVAGSISWTILVILIYFTNPGIGLSLLIFMILGSMGFGFLFSLVFSFIPLWVLFLGGFGRGGGFSSGGSSGGGFSGGGGSFGGGGSSGGW